MTSVIIENDLYHSITDIMKTLSISNLSKDLKILQGAGIWKQLVGGRSGGNIRFRHTSIMALLRKKRSKRGIPWGLALQFYA